MSKESNANNEQYKFIINHTHQERVHSELFHVTLEGGELPEPVDVATVLINDNLNLSEERKDELVNQFIDSVTPDAMNMLAERLGLRKVVEAVVKEDLNSPEKADIH